ncbi:hypothetical protein HAX54_022089, partial [Datura stramonium]|nr:hypothetical protein [Datura stramonium]
TSLLTKVSPRCLTVLLSEKLEATVQVRAMITQPTQQAIASTNTTREARATKVQDLAKGSPLIFCDSKMGGVSREQRKGEMPRTEDLRTPA